MTTGGQTTRVLNCTKVQTKKERVGIVMTSEKKGKKGAKFAQVHIPAFLPDVPAVEFTSDRVSLGTDSTWKRCVQIT